MFETLSCWSVLVQCAEGSMRCGYLVSRSIVLDGSLSYVRFDNVKIMSVHVLTCAGCSFSTIVIICFKAMSEIRGVCVYLLSKND